MDDKNELWAVLQCETGYGYGDGDAWSACTLFDEKDEALAYINHVIRDEWTTTITIPTEDDPYNEELLADHKGYSFPADTVKWSNVYYAEDGSEAWYQRDGIIKKIGLAKVKPNRERFCI